MNYPHVEVGTTIPTLINKLCNHFAKDSTELSAKLFRIAIGYLTSPSSSGTVAGDEQYITTCIRKTLTSKQSAEDVQSFELLYSRLQKSKILNQRCAVLVFLSNVGTGFTTKESNQWGILQELHQANSDITTTRSQASLFRDDSKTSIRRPCSAPRPSNTVVTTLALWPGSETDLTDKSSSAPSSRTSLSVSERELIQEVIYALQGIEGFLLKKEPGGLAFTIDLKAGRGITPVQRELLGRLIEVGFLHNKIKQYCDEIDKHVGVVGQSLTAILRDELTEYYKLIAVLQTQLKKQSCTEHTELTLRRMLVWIAEPQLHLQWLAYITEFCTNKKGGALISAIHGFLQHGSKSVQKVSTKVLSAVCRPLFIMMSHWLLDGELNDPYGEFFIEARNISTEERLWHDKYHVKVSMIPSFISMEQAKKILVMGKSINFLRQVCKDSNQLPGRESLQKLFTNSTAEVLFSPEQNIEFHYTLENVYRETSIRVLDMLREKYRLMEHLQSLRRYLLLGQGDFIRHLLELLAPELAKPAQDLYGHTLSAILESAIRVTNAQYEEEDTLQRLNVELMDRSFGDMGWDVFNLIYIVDGPVSTIFQPTMDIYRCLFGALWKAKRMEHVLSNMRKQQISSAKLFRHMKELKPIMHLINLLSNEMIHFLHQTQYYFLFEVLECSWAEMLRQVNQAESLDDVISAHNIFLNSVKCGVLLDNGSTELCSQLLVIYKLIINLETIQENLFIATNEHEATTQVSEENKKGKPEHTRKFNVFLNSIKIQVKQLATSYNEFIRKYLMLLASNSNLNLQLLSVRLNFNDHYKVF